MKPITPDAAALVDTLRFRLSASSTLPRSTVRVTVQVHTLVSTGDQDHDALVARVREALARFIDATWTVSGVTRKSDDTGFERVELTASAMVPVRENYNLQERARRASVEGLAITDPSVDSRLPGKVIAEATMGLQEYIVELAQQRIERFDRATGRKWRIGDIQFGLDSEGYDVSPKLARRETALLEGASDDLLTTSERLTLVAQVTLKSNAA
jgi:hypothetical protein